MTPTRNRPLFGNRPPTRLRRLLPILIPLLLIAAVRPGDLRKGNGISVPEGHLTIARHFSGGKMRPFLHT
jgi:hypothetical protein